MRKDSLVATREKMASLGLLWQLGGPLCSPKSITCFCLHPLQSFPITAAKRSSRSDHVLPLLSPSRSAFPRPSLPGASPPPLPAGSWSLCSLLVTLPPPRVSPYAVPPRPSLLNSLLLKRPRKLHPPPPPCTSSPALSLLPSTQSHVPPVHLT